MDTSLRAYIELAYRYYMEDRLDVAMQVVDDAFQDVGWPAGAWDAFYNELVCEKDARDASDPREVDGIKIELDRGAPDVMFKIVSSAAVEARAKIRDTLKVEFRRPVIVTIFQPDAATDFIYGSYGYCTNKYELDKVCLPRSCVLSYPECLDALTHEFTHVGVFEIAGSDVPAWLNEGLAMHITGDVPKSSAPQIPNLATRYPRLTTASAIQRALTTIDPRKDDPGSVTAAYHLAGSLVAYWTENHGLDTVLAALQRIGAGDSEGRAVGHAIGESVGRLEREWRKAIGL